MLFITGYNILCSDTHLGTENEEPLVNDVNGNLYQPLRQHQLVLVGFAELSWADLQYIYGYETDETVSH